MEEKLTHFDEKGNAIMVDVTEKKITSRTATASGKIHVNEAVMKAVYHMPVKVRSVSLGEGLDATICIPVPDLSPGRPAGFYGASGLRYEPSAN